MADFLGASNLLPGTVAGADGDVARVALDGGAEVRASRADRLPGGRDRVKVGVRPEKLRPLSGRATPTSWNENELRGQVVTATYLGLGHQFAVERPGRHDPDRLRPERRRRPRRRAGDEVRLRWRPEHTFVV